MNLDNFDPVMLIEIARKNQEFILQNELEGGVPLNYMDDQGQYVFKYKHGTVLQASLDLSFNENLERHKKMMQANE